ncbi:MAG: glycosyl hydrolase, partial [Hymenobacter sp.]
MPTLFRPLAALLLLPALALAQASLPAEASYIAGQQTTGSFPLVAGGQAAPLYLGADEWPGVQRAAHDLQADINRVTGRTPTLRTVAPTAGQQPVVLVGTLGHSALIDELVRGGKLDAGALRGKWEKFVVQAVDNPLPGVARALVVAGSDKRGTIFGLYDLSAQMGVSPWYWWADVPVRHQKSLYVAAGAHTLGEPKVKYRGIFINDEAPAFAGWAKEKFGGVNHAVYGHLFELILRLRGNYLWPAMWGNMFAVDDPQSPALADEYGVVMGTSHHEPLTRAHEEWKVSGHGPWNYQTNDTTLRRFWRQGMRRMGHRENIVTIGMRGDGDEPMSQESNIALLEKIVADQRQIIAEETHKPADQTPQMWALYKEVQDYYD